MSRSAFGINRKLAGLTAAEAITPTAVEASGHRSSFTKKASKPTSICTLIAKIREGKSVGVAAKGGRQEGTEVVEAQLFFDYK